MSKRLNKSGSGIPAATGAGAYDQLLGNITGLLEAARHTSARVVNALMTATYWEVGRRIVEYEQGGKERAEYGEMILRRLAVDLTKHFGRGFGVDNLQRMRVFYLDYPPDRIYATVSRKLELSEKSATASRKSLAKAEPQILSTVSTISQTPSEKLDTFCLSALSQAFPLSWSHYVRLLSVKSPDARTFYETEALRGGWPVRQLDRQITSLFYERTALSRNKAAMLEKGGKPIPADVVTPEQEIKDPFILEFLGLKDEYSETDLEDALVQQGSDCRIQARPARREDAGRRDRTHPKIFGGPETMMPAIAQQRPPISAPVFHFDNAFSYLAAHAADHKLNVSREDLKALAVGVARGFPVVSDDSRMRCVADANVIDCWSTIRLLKVMVTTKRIDMNMVTQVLQYLEHENDLPMSKNELRKQFKDYFGTDCLI